MRVTALADASPAQRLRWNTAAKRAMPRLGLIVAAVTVIAAACLASVAVATIVDATVVGATEPAPKRDLYCFSCAWR